MNTYEHNGPNEPAFPSFSEIGGKEVIGGVGMTMREWYAGQALIGLLAFDDDGANQFTPAIAAREAFRMADAMLAEARKGRAA